MLNHYQRIKQLYSNLHGDSTELFQEILTAASEIGLEEALAYLEQCVMEKRTMWLQDNLGKPANENDPVTEGYKWFYEKYLGVSVPEDGEIVEHTDKRMVMRWRNPCPTLEACNQLGMDTRQVCKMAYEKPVEEFLKHIHPKLRFQRNYESIRPHTAYCEEIITLED